MEKYHHTCVLCWAEATEMHEEPPKSEGGKQGRNSYPLCKPCHELVTEHRSVRGKVLAGAREVLEFYDVREDL